MRAAVKSEPTGGTVCVANNAHARRRIHLSCLWIRKRSNDGVESSSIVDEGHLFHALGIELLVGDLLTAGTPTPTVATKQLFFINPIESPVDCVPRAVVG